MKSIPLHIEKTCDLMDALGPISHDLHNIFNGIVLQAAIASRGLSEEAAEKVAELRAMVLEASRKLAQVDAIRHHLSIPREAVDVNAVIQNVLELFEPSPLSIQVEPAREMPQVLSNSCELTRLLVMLLRCSQGALQEAAREGSIRLSTDATSDCVRIYIDDNGPAIEEDRLMDFYDPFHPLRPGENAFDRAASYSLAKRLNADLRIENLKNQGARVILELEAV